ncbi:MAG: GNAT family N-acetyltransferase [bacterium]
MTENVVVKKSKIHGKGVFAAADFKKGEPILDVDDSHIVTDTSKLTKKNYDFDLDFLANGKIIWMQPPEKYINHSCDPNVYFKTISGIRKVYAMRDISKCDEFTCDYTINGWGDATFECNCGSENCRKIWCADFFKLSMSIQRKYLPYLEDWFKEQIKEKLPEASMIKGSVIHLIPATFEDKRWIYEAGIHPTIAPLCMGPPLFPDHPIPTWEEFCRDYKDFYFDGSALDKGMNYIICVGDERIGVIGYTCYHLRHHKAEVDIWMNHIKNCGKGYGSDAIKTLCRYLFQTQGINEFFMRPSARNERAVRAYEKAGFRRIYTERSEFIKNEFLPGYGMGDYEDEVRLGLKIEE